MMKLLCLLQGELSKVLLFFWILTISLLCVHVCMCGVFKWLFSTRNMIYEVYMSTCEISPFIMCLFNFRLQQETRDFMAMLRHYKLPLDEAFINAPVLTLEQVSQKIFSHFIYFGLGAFV